MNYHVMYAGVTCETFDHTRTDAEAKKYACARYPYFDSLEDDNDRVICTKPKTEDSE